MNQSRKHHFFNCIIYVLTFCFFFLNTALPFHNGKAYPHVKKANLYFRVQIKNQAAISKEVIIKDIKGKPAYKLTVYTVSLDNKTANSIAVELNGIGDTSTKFDTKYEQDLLNPDKWGHGSGQRHFSPKELCQENRNNLNWGHRRIFILRRMRIEVIVSKIQLNEDFSGIISADVTVQITPNKSQRSRPKDVIYKEPNICIGKQDTKLTFESG